ncbi:mitogen-activated protein kinase kinase kinase 1-like [Solanum dulcamara]|uniref:mitogen-activated protein kinase kinase kinase 1-like n=1 Tax=Solanum dulcamara TaxID=45834 RepID=UPI0024867883|nr:mitogen-activated protein kinase kinase kinase 1-like [Solanum dulcamara]
MHRLPGVFAQKKRVNSKQKRAESPVQPKPRLQRLNARKNIDYEPSMLEFSGDKSFRIQGKDGDFIEFFEKLGFSGPDDFAIPTDEWDAMIVRSSLDNHVIDVTSNASCCGGGETQCSGSGRVIDLGSNLIKENICRNSDSSKASDVIQLQVQSVKLNYDSGGVVCAARVISDVSEIGSRLDDGVTANGVVSNRNELVSLLGGAGGGGIRGLRPPLLAPPPVMSLPIVDDACSTWDIFRAFGPEDHRESGIVGHASCKSELFDGDEECIKNEEYEENSTRRIIGAGSLLSQSSSFTTTSNDDDSSSSTTERMSIISPNGRFTRIITQWDKGGLLGRGSFGSVYEGISDDGFFFAVKEVSLLDQGDGGRQSLYQLEQEIELLRQFEHENIVQYYGTDKSDSKLYIFLELVSQGSLLNLYQKYHLRDSQASAYTRQILHGLKYLHDRNVVHRDIKCANILVHANGSVKLADFGLAKATKFNDVKSFKGTALWMAPEVVNRKNHGYGLAADIWSLGCTVLEMLTRQFPYSHLDNQMQVLYRIGKGEPPAVPNTLSVDARNFINHCLQVDPSARPTATQLLEHPFVKRTLPSSSGSASPLNLGRRL